MKSDVNKRKKKQNLEEPFEDEDNKDWWSRYFASVDAMIKANQDLKTDGGTNSGSRNTLNNLPNGDPPINDDSERTIPFKLVYLVLSYNIIRPNLTMRLNLVKLSLID